jgi:hypothetical protein
LVLTAACSVHANNTEPWELVGNRTSDPSISELPKDDDCTETDKVGYSCTPAISHNRFEPVSFPGRQVNFTWDAPGQTVGPNNSYITTTTAGSPRFVAWLGQFNITYTALITVEENTGFSYQPASEVFETDPALNGTAFVALTDSDLFVTPYNLTQINPHVVALGVYQAG